MLLELIAIASACVNISVGCLVFYNYLNFKKIMINLIKMNAEELLDISQAIPQDATSQEAVQGTKRERLSAIIVGGGSCHYFGRDVQLTDLDKMTPQEIDKLYCRYEARLGASMTKTLGNSFINLYVMAVSRYFNVTNPPKLIEDLEEDPFINHALPSVCCELYYKYGMYLAPFTVMLTTARHIDFNKIKNIVDNKNGKSEFESGESESGKSDQ